MASMLIFVLNSTMRILRSANKFLFISAFFSRTEVCRLCLFKINIINILAEYTVSTIAKFNMLKV